MTRKAVGRLKALWFWGLVFGAAIVLGGGEILGESVVQSSAVDLPWFQRWDVPKILIWAAIAVMAWLAVQKLDRIDKKFDMLFKWRDDHVEKTHGDVTIRLTTIETEHRLRTGHDCHPRRRAEDREE